jgi:hypothetical protein
MIIEASGRGEITKTEAKILLNQQKVAAASVFAAAEGMTLVAAQTAINAALKGSRTSSTARRGSRCCRRTEFAAYHSRTIAWT